LLKEGMQAGGQRVEEVREAGAEGGVQRAVKDHVFQCFGAAAAVRALALAPRESLPSPLRCCPPVGARAPLRQRFTVVALSYAG